MPNQTLTDWLAHFSHLHDKPIDMGLGRVKAVWQTLCENAGIERLATEKIITVSGTNGKGSTCHMLSLLLSAQAYRVGVFTSPHIHQFNERIQINGVNISDQALCVAFAAIEAARGHITLSYFEAATLASLLYFAQQQVDFVILEVGLGGRLDAVNIVDADAVIITSIGLDHEAYLGNDLSKIALEKAGVCRTGAPTVYAEAGVYDSVVALTTKNHIPLIANERDYFIDDTQVDIDNKRFSIPAHIVQLGTHQISNYAGVIVLLHRLNLLPTHYSDILSRFALVGRLHCIQDQPRIIVDVAHNQASAEALAAYLKKNAHQFNRLYAVIGMLNDKDHAGVLRIFSHVFQGVFLGTIDDSRGLSDSELATLATPHFDCPIACCGSLVAALTVAKQQAADDDGIVAFGSFHVAEALLAA